MIQQSINYVLIYALGWMLTIGTIIAYLLILCVGILHRDDVDNIKHSMLLTIFAGMLLIELLLLYIGYDFIILYLLRIDNLEVYFIISGIIGILLDLILGIILLYFGKLNSENHGNIMRIYGLLYFLLFVDSILSIFLYYTFQIYHPLYLLSPLTLYYFNALITLLGFLLIIIYGIEVREKILSLAGFLFGGYLIFQIAYFFLIIQPNLEGFLV